MTSVALTLFILGQTASAPAEEPAAEDLLRQLTETREEIARVVLTKGRKGSATANVVGQIERRFAQVESLSRGRIYGWHHHQYPMPGRWTFVLGENRTGALQHLLEEWVLPEFKKREDVAEERIEELEAAKAIYAEHAVTEALSDRLMWDRWHLKLLLAATPDGLEDVRAVDSQLAEVIGKDLAAWADEAITRAILGSVVAAERIAKWAKLCGRGIPEPLPEDFADAGYGDRDSFLLMSRILSDWLVWRELLPKKPKAAPPIRLYCREEVTARREAAELRRLRRKAGQVEATHPRPNPAYRGKK